MLPSSMQSFLFHINLILLRPVSIVYGHDQAYACPAKIVLLHALLCVTFLHQTLIFENTFLRNNSDSLKVIKIHLIKFYSAAFGTTAWMLRVICKEMYCVIYRATYLLFYRFYFNG
jgi:hypothetical protein